MRQKKHIVYPIFLPHAGCPFTCVYCNQAAVSGIPSSRVAGTHSLLEHAREHIDIQARSARKCGIAGEIAFYGGTFTALPLPIQRKILSEASARVYDGAFSGIRFSTRPDFIDRHICEVLHEFPVTTIELGAQSLSGPVLMASERGYDRFVVRTAGDMIRENGWKLGLQLMPGLPGDTQERFSRTVLRAIRMQPDMVRIYPTLVMKHTRLAVLAREGRYLPLSLEEAVRWCATAFESFHGAGINVIRMGLHADVELTSAGMILAGPFHPAFGYLVLSTWWRERVSKLIVGDAPRGGERLILRVNTEKTSEVIGPHQANINYWRDRFQFSDIEIQGTHGLEDDTFEYQYSTSLLLQDTFDTTRRRRRNRRGSVDRRVHNEEMNDG